MDISIITVGMNHLKFLKDLFPSIFSEGFTTAKFEVLYVDNCSSDGSVEYISENFPQVIIIQNIIPKGFGANNNLAAQKAKGDYLAIINPDIILFKDSLDALFRYLKSNPEIGILAPKLLNKDLTYQNSVRRFITPKLFVSRVLAKGDDSKINLGNSSYLCKDIKIDEIQPINWSVGAAYFLTNTHFKNLKGFDEDYFLYMEDEDLCLRSWKIGKSVIYFPQSVMIHNHMRSSKKIGKSMKWHFQSLFKFWKKHGVKISDYSNQNNLTNN
ncbi:glycosyltransferase family 2 protein [Sphingobacterium sp. HJSM2_6]|uniref:glycosyltransferase family 2 protein n=1 Tax=Sphingobacterium sp. HJSM2_6 TaxID=3366264 RepID=UPI003BC29DFD